ncbi:MAG: ABC transporter permease [Saprospiraceae bacterium]|nr:MAG: ABC transporter permease [Saprospiraceae bacterium]
MIKNYLRIAFRNLLKHKGYTLINIFGLALGMMVFLLIAQYVKFERSYETFLPNADQIYRVTLERYLNNELQIASAENFPGVGPAMQEELPEVLSYARLYNLGYKNNVIITNKEASPEPIAFKHRHFMYADSAFLILMGYEMSKGDPVTALAEPLKAVISEDYATKYFGEADPIGKSLLMQDDDFNNELVQITGVFKNLPANTHLKFDVLFSYQTLYGRFERAPERYDQNWARKDMYTFVKLREGADPKNVEAALPGIVDKYSPTLAENNRKDVLALQPLTAIHLTSDLAEEPESNGDERIVFFMSLIGIFVILIAWINYINLSTARAVERGREVGVRKVVGAEKGQLITQFLVEAMLVNFVAILLAFILTILVLPWFNQISGLTLEIRALFRPWFLGLLGILWMIGGLLSGLYPALVLSSFQPIAVLKGQLKNTARGVLLRKGLVVAQFMASVVLIVATFVIYNQLNFMLKGDMGMNIDQVLVVERPGISERDRNAYNSAIDVFRAELLKNNDIEAVSASLTVPGKQREYKGTIKRFGASDNELVSVRINSMDYEFLDVFKMEMVAGRGFSRDFPADQDTSIILTESTSRMLGFAKPEDAIGQTLTAPGWQWNPIVAGVVNDYNQVSLKKALEPSAFYCSPYQGEFYSMRIKTDNLAKTLAHAEQSWTKAFPGNPFDYFFLDDYFNRQYENEQRFGSLTTIFAILAIIVGCLGLFGLSGFTIAQRTKEIGIRKVLGATTTNIVTLLSKDFLKLVALAIVLAIPVAWWAMNNWLNGFANRIDLHWWILALAGLVAVTIAFLTVSFQSIKAALSNPVESIRTE